MILVILYNYYVYHSTMHVYFCFYVFYSIVNALCENKIYIKFMEESIIRLLLLLIDIEIKITK